MAKRNHETAAADAAVKYIPVEIGGKTYRLAYSFNGLAAAEKETGCNLLQGMREMIVGGLSAANFRGLLYAGVHKAHPKLTLDEVGDLLQVSMDEGSTLEVQKALLLTYGISFEQTDPSGAAPPAENSGAPNSDTGNSGNGSGETPAYTSD